MCFFDIGGESTRPGATAVGVRQEWERVKGVLEMIYEERREESGNAGNDGEKREGREKGWSDIIVSLDTRHWEVAEWGLERGWVDVVNDVSGMLFLWFFCFLRHLALF